jgi:hypothetical protein
LGIVLSIAGTAGSMAPAGAAPAWSVIGPVAGAPYGSLASVWCAGPARCFAVGAADTPTSVTRLVERWTGASWSLMSSRSPSPATSSQFTSVHCVTSTNCVAVGQYGSVVSTRPLVERWNGTAWSLVPSPRPAGIAVSGLASVWCTSNTFCVAVGSSFVSTADSSAERTLVERWNGKRWSIVASPNRRDAVGSGLVAVTCTSASSCLAVGHSDTNLATRTLVEHWNGAGWSIVDSPNPANNPANELRGVACPGSRSCFAVGSGRGTLVEHWNGSSWSIPASPDPTGATGAGLTGVSCPSVRRCYSVGDFFVGNTVQQLVETWNGASWTIVATPVPSGATRSSLGGVSCVTTASCFVVGEYRLGSTRRPLIIRLS